MKKVYKILAVLLAISICMMMPVSAETHTYIGIYDLAYEYSLNAYGYAIIENVSSCGDYSSSELIIPETVDGYTVVALADRAYALLEETWVITDIYFPATITSIGDHVFGECSNLIAVHYGGTESQWATLMDNGGEGNDTFCEEIGYFTEKGCEYFIYTEGPLAGMADMVMYRGPLDETNVEIPATLGGRTVWSVGAYPMSSPTFWQHNSIEHITFPDSVTSLHDLGLERSPLKEIVLPSNLQSIDSDCFHYCAELKTATIPDSLDKLGYIFKGCTALEDIYFEGTQTEWNAYEIAEYIPLYHPEVTVHFGEESGQCGDVDDNGDIDMNDALKLYQNACGRAVSTALLSAEDINDDGIVNMMDALLLYGMVS